nr:MAG TPA: hypothetical protein [Bacteriophage sp.]
MFFEIRFAISIFGSIYTRTSTASRNFYITSTFKRVCLIVYY